MPAQRRPIPRPPTPALLLLLTIIAHALAAPALAQVQTGPALPLRESHGWGILPTGPKGKPTLIHLPPRDGPGAVPRGTVRTAAWFSEAPEALASWDSRVYLVFPRSPATDAAAPRRVTMAAAQRVVAGVWETQPPGRLRTLPALPGDGALAAFTAGGAGPAALIHAPAAPGSGDSPWRLLALDGQRWLDLPIPPECVRDLGPDPALVGTETGLVLLTTVGPGAVLWELPSSGPPADAASLWRRHELRWGDAPAGGEVLSLGGRLMRLRADDAGHLRLDLIRPGPGGGVFSAATLDGVPPGAQPIALDAAGDLALLWTDPAPPAGEPAAARPAPLHVREVAALTGRTLYDGATAGPSLVATPQFRLLAVALILVMVTVLLYILRPGAGEAKGAPSLPTGIAVAEPGRRIAAGLADFLVGLIAASWAMGFDTADIIGPALLGMVEGTGAGGPELAALGLALVITFAHTTLGESLLGRSIGKTLAGCEVVRIITPAPAPPAAAADPESAPADVTPAMATILERPTFPRAALRNLVRWVLPPLALWLFVDPTGRHPGDLLAGTAVIVRRPSGAPGPHPEDRPRE